MQVPLATVLLLALATGRCDAGGARSPAQPTNAAAATQQTACPRPTDDRGQPLYQTESGAFVERKTDPGGARYVVMTPPEAAANQAYRVTEDVYEKVRELPRGRRITLVGYVSSAASGANPTYSCVEY